MQVFRKALFASVAAGLLGIGSAQAALSVSSVQGGAATGSVRYNFDNMTLTNGQLPASSQVVAPSFGDPSLAMTVNITPNARVVQGSTGQYAAPFLTLSNGIGFGPNGTDQANVPGANTTTYLTAGSTGATAGAQIELVLPFSAQYFGILWGSIDSYNTLRFFDGATLVGTLTGSNVTATPTGSQSADGTRYVNITSTTAFNRVVATSTDFAFEFDNVALARDPGGADPSIVPAPAALALFGLGLLALGALRRRA
jgi:hypothetical protein